MRPSLSLPPEEFWRGTSLSDAANSRPDRNWAGSVTDAAKAVALITPTPGIGQSLAFLILPMLSQQAPVERLDLSKHVFYVHAVDEAGEPVMAKAIPTEEFQAGDRSLSGTLASASFAGSGETPASTSLRPCT